jgi:hypothetical protein
MAKSKFWGKDTEVKEKPADTLFKEVREKMQEPEVKEETKPAVELPPLIPQLPPIDIGISLYEYISIMAMHALISSNAGVLHNNRRKIDIMDDAIKCADMLFERLKDDGP